MLPPPLFLGAGEATRLLHALTPAAPGGLVAQLMAARSGEGTSSLARDLVIVAARMPEARVLLLDLDPPGRKQWSHLRGLLPETASQLMPGLAADLVVHRLGATGLHVSELRGELPAGPSAWAPVLPVLRASFSLVLIDSPPLARAFDGVLRAAAIDTTLLVVEAEATRSAVARNLRDRIREVGGRIAGVVLNKRRFHIPQRIYERL